MQQLPPKPNRTDAAVRDYFHSKTFKTLLTVIGVVFAVGFVCVCVIFFVSFGGLVALGNWLNP